MSDNKLPAYQLSSPALMKGAVTSTYLILIGRCIISLLLGVLFYLHQITIRVRSHLKFASWQQIYHRFSEMSLDVDFVSDSQDADYPPLKWS